MSERTIAFIPARGGSKGLPGKNIRPLNGRPLIDYTIKAALEANLDEVWVSTNCPDIEAVSLESGAKVLKRPDSLCEDSSPTEDALLHFSDCVPEFKRLVMLQCTSPLTRVVDIESALEKHIHGKYDTVLSVCHNVGGFHCGGYNWEATGNDHFYRTTAYYAQRQKAPVTYRENGGLYVIDKFTLQETKKRIGGQVGCYVMPKHRSFEIDYLHEFEELEFLINSGFIDYMDERERPVN